MLPATSVEVALLITEPVPHLVFFLNDSCRQVATNAVEYEECPLPPERVDQHDKAEPVDEF